MSLFQNAFKITAGNVDKIVMDMNEMERIIHLLSQTAQRVEQSGQLVQETSKHLEAGAMLGQSGTALSDGLKQRLAPSIASLADTLRTAERYCRTEVVDMQQAIQQNKQRHK
jgi:hypothetical protein